MSDQNSLQQIRDSVSKLCSDFDSKYWQEIDKKSLYPEKRFYVTQKTTMTESSVKKIWFDDLYLSLGEQLDNETWIIRAYYKPFIMFLWIGVILIGLGGIFSLLQYYSFNSSTLYVKKN